MTIKFMFLLCLWIVGSSFLDFCKQAQLSVTSKSNGKVLPPLNKAQVIISNGTAAAVVTTKVKVEETSANSKGSSGARRPPPLLHRPSGVLPSTSKGNAQKGNNLTVTSMRPNTSLVDTGDNSENGYYDEGNDEDLTQFLQPETVFSDDEHGSSNSPGKKTG